MKVVQKIFTVLLLMFIIVSSVGISFYLHQCGCREATLFSFEAGYSKPDEFCCCSVEPITDEPSCCTEAEKEESCKDQYFFILLPFGPEKVTTDAKPLFGKTLSLLRPAQILMSDPSNQSEPGMQPNPPPRLLSGTQLVYFIQQIKIPFPIS